MDDRTREPNEAYIRSELEMNNKFSIQQDVYFEHQILYDNQ